MVVLQGPPPKRSWRRRTPSGGREAASASLVFFVRVEEEVLARGDTDREEIDRFFFPVESRGMREEVGLIPC
jgi:hypothetical protein